MMTSNDQPIEVYYNAACPVCNAGVNENRRAMEKRDAGEGARWIDMSASPDALRQEGLTLDDVRRYIYVRDGAGKLHRGADACAVMWLATPGRHWLSRITRSPFVRPLARFGYCRFADLLYWWNKRVGRW